MVLKNVTIGFPSLVSPNDFGEGTPKYQATILIDKDDKVNLEAFEKAFQEAVAEGAAKLGKTKPKSPLRDGSERADTYPEFDGTMFFNARSNRKPKVFSTERGEDGKFLVLTDEEVFDQAFAGQIVNVKVSLYAFAMQANKGIAVGIDSVQVVGGGTPVLGSGGDEYED